MIYKFEQLNNGVEIVDPEVSVYFAGFYTENGGKMVLGIQLKNDSANVKVELTKNGSTTDRSDEAIYKLMVELLEPYKV